MYNLKIVFFIQYSYFFCIFFNSFESNVFSHTLSNRRVISFNEDISGFERLEDSSTQSMTASAESLAGDSEQDEDGGEESWHSTSLHDSDSDNLEDTHALENLSHHFEYEDDFDFEDSSDDSDDNEQRKRFRRSFNDDDEDGSTIRSSSQHY